uniref:Membrane protein UL43 n=1 Tax=Bovine alphaherpesvirus 2 TaxID=10295 RepID=Q8JQA6_9ALPH|nr:membrane protein UL43 [Bovine alphaherpesvirus 2]
MDGACCGSNRSPATLTHDAGRTPPPPVADNKGSEHTVEVEPADELTRCAVGCALKFMLCMATFWLQGFAMGFLSAAVIAHGRGALEFACVFAVTASVAACTPLKYATTARRPCVWIRCAISLLGLALWVLADADGNPGVWMAIKCLAFCAAILSSAILSADARSMFTARHAFFLLFAIATCAGFGMGASSPLWRAGKCGAPVLAAMLMVHLSGVAANDCRKKMCKRHVEYVYGLPRLHATPAGKPENFSTPALALTVAASLATNFAQTAARALGPDGPRMWLQAFGLGHFAAALSTAAQVLSRRDLTDALLIAHLALLLGACALMYASALAALCLVVGGAVWITLAQVFGLQRRMQGRADDDPAAGLLCGMLFAVYALGLVLGTTSSMERA